MKAPPDCFVPSHKIEIPFKIPESAKTIMTKCRNGRGSETLDDFRLIACDVDKNVRKYPWNFWVVRKFTNYSSLFCYSLGFVITRIFIRCHNIFYVLLFKVKQTFGINFEISKKRGEEIGRFFPLSSSFLSEIVIFQFSFLELSRNIILLSEVN